MKKTNFFKFENKNDDFPFYNDGSITITHVQSLFILAVTIGGVFLFQFVQMPSLISPFINLIFPLGALILVVGSKWNKLFRKIHLRDIKLVIIALVVMLLYASISATLMTTYFGGGNANPVGTSVQTNSLYMNILLFLNTIPMLLGEELLTIIPFLIILQFSTRTLKVSRKKAVVIAWIVSSLIFGSLHLPTYKWNFIQAVFLISGTRLILTYTYMKTKNTWISFLVHILYDWCLFLIPVLLVK